MLECQYMQWAKNQKGFTIVELFIVVVVIAILAAITIVAYNGIQNRAKASALQSTASQATKKVMSFAVLNADQYPANLAAADIANNGNTTYQYSVNNSTNPKTYCVTATASTLSYYSSNTQTAPIAGACPGHGINGAVAIVNIAKNPLGVAGGSSWFVPLGTTVDTANVSFSSRADWHRFTAAASGNKVMRFYLDLADLENGATYTASALVANDTASSVFVSMDFSDQGTTGFTLAPGEIRRLYVTGARATYDSIYRFIDIDGITTSSSILITDVMLTKGSVEYNFGYGASANWVWDGTPNASTSRGSAL